MFPVVHGGPVTPMSTVRSRTPSPTPVRQGTLRTVLSKVDAHRLLGWVSLGSFVPDACLRGSTRFPVDMGVGDRGPVWKGSWVGDVCRERRDGGWS